MTLTGEAGVTLSAEAALREAAGALPPISLPELLATAELQTRTDRKYFVPLDTFVTFTELMSQELVALDIGGTRLFDYESTYFDSADFVTFRAHVQRRRRRFKLRTRTYLDSGECMLEVKLEGRRAATVKHRVAYPMDRRHELTPEAREFLGRILEGAYGVAPPEGLRPVMTTRYFRSTLACRSEPARLTCDVALVCDAAAPGAPAPGSRQVLRARDQQVLVESKSVGGSVADRMLREMGVRPISVSKYCVGLAGLHPELTSNPWRRTLRRHFELASA